MIFSASENRVSARLSVRELVGFVVRSGSLSVGARASRDALEEGKEIHKALEARLKGEIENYASEVRMSLTRLVLGVEITLSGIADGVFFKDGSYTVDEIKSVLSGGDSPSRDALDVHLAQAKCYALMLCESRRLDRINIRLCYVYGAEGRRIEYKEFSYTREELSAFYQRLLTEYIEQNGISRERIENRSLGADEMKFPFPHLRDGQKGLIRECYAAMKGKYNLYASAPTGIGKTLSVIYPSLKALGRGRADKVFYLTPKGSIQRNAEEAIELLQKDRVFLKSVTISAKKKMCCDASDCDCDNCEYAKDYFDKVGSAKKELLAEKRHLTSELISAVAKKYKVCPFELSLDVSRACDFIICDYNYVFDPTVVLKRFAESPESYIILTDEAHNLVERVRENYSAEISPEDFIDCLPFVEKNKAVTECISDINKIFLKNKKALEEGAAGISFEPPSELAGALKSMLAALSPYFAVGELQGEMKEAITDLFFKCRDFVLAEARYDSCYSTISKESGGEKIYLVDPSPVIRKTVGKWGMGIFFSATLLPQEYYFRMLGGEEDRDIFIEIPSPFDSNNFLVMTSDISTKYTDRGETVSKISDLIYASSSRKGNFLVFFPSYEYLDRVLADYKKRYGGEIIAQTADMKMSERRAFIDRFKTERGGNLIGFAVLGGAFSEGIDLVGDALSGVVIVGVGLPPPTAERESVSRHFAEMELDGRAIAYVLPGFNRVLQAAGRVIRSEDDRGFLILCDSRFRDSDYISMFPQSFENMFEPQDDREIKNALDEFFEY